MKRILILQINSTIWRHTNVNNVIVSIKLFLDVGNGKYIILCNFGGHFLSGFEVTEGASEVPPPAPSRSQGAKKKKTGLNRAKH